MAKPYKEKYVWPLILEKCWAKMFNSYPRTNCIYVLIKMDITLKHYMP